MSEGIASLLSTASDTARLRLQAGNGEQQVNDEIFQQFEALFLQQMLKSMRTASLSEGMFQSEQSEFYREMYDQQIATDLAKKEVLGIANILSRQLGGDTSEQTGEEEQVTHASLFNQAVANGVELVREEINTQTVEQVQHGLNNFVDKLSSNLQMDSKIDNAVNSYHICDQLSNR